MLSFILSMMFSNDAVFGWQHSNEIRTGKY